MNRNTAQKNSWADPDIRARRIAAMKLAANDPVKTAKRLATFKTAKFKRRHGKALKKLWKDPNYVSKQHASRKIAQSRPAVKEAKSIRGKRAWADNPGRKVKHVAMLRKRYESLTPKQKEEFAITGAAQLLKGVKKMWADPIRKSKMVELRRRVGADPVLRAANAARLRAKWTDPEYRAMMIEKRKNSYTPERFQRAGATRRANGKPSWNKGLTAATDSRLAKTSAKLRGRIPTYGKNKKSCIYRNGSVSIQMRSKWEVAYAQYLDSKGIDWLYEPKFFSIGKGQWNGVTYVPDFYLPHIDTWVEIKGYLTQSNKRKISAFKKKYPELKYKLLFGADLIERGLLDIHGCTLFDKVA